MKNFSFKIFQQLIGGFVKPVGTFGEMQQNTVEALGYGRVNFSQIKAEYLHIPFFCDENCSEIDLSYYLALIMWMD